MIRALLAAACAALSVSTGLAADLSRQPISKAPGFAAPLPDWTGFYIGGGGGYGMWDHDVQSLAAGNVISPTVNAGGKGYFGTVAAGFDGQFTERLLLGVFADYDISDIEGDTLLPTFFDVVPEKQKWAWSAGARIGYLVTPAVLSYINAGYTQAHFARGTTFKANGDAPRGTFVDSHTDAGWFVGGGAEVMIHPGWFARTEYRYASYKRDSIPIIEEETGESDGTAIGSRRAVQTIRSELTYKFNWSRPLIARY